MINNRFITKGLAFKLSLSILCATALIISGILYYNYHFSKRLLLESARETAEQLTRATLNRMESVLISAQRVPESLLLFLQHPSFNEESLKEMLGFVLQNKPEVFGSAVAFAPYALQPDKEGYAPYYYRSGEGFEFKNLDNEDYKYFNWDWYTLARDSGQPLWTEPYLDLGGSNILMSTYSLPFYSESSSGQAFRGVITADLSLGWLEEMMNSIKVFETGYVILISEKGTVITHPIRHFQMRNLSELSQEAHNKSMAEIADHMIQTGEGFFPFISLVDKRPSWMYYSTLPQTKWHMAVVFPEEELFAGLHKLFLYTIFMGILGIILLSVIVILFSAQITKPLRKLTVTANLIGEGNFNVDIREESSTREISMLGHALSRMQAELKDYMRNLESTTAAKERFESELNIAHDIQQGMIPKIFPPFPDREDVDIYALLEPARQVGGDFYDFFFLDDETLFFAIGDVSDKGVPAALMMSMTITLFRAKSDISHEINKIVDSLNHDISRDNVNLMFVTFFMGILNVRTGKLRYCNAGHNYPLLMRKDGRLETLAETHGIPLGINVDQVYKSGDIALDKSETLVLFTDGITEALNMKGEFYGDERLENLIRNRCRGLDPGQITGTIMEDVIGFADTPERSDDITLLVLSYFPPEKQ
jgi:sigma-B regulation protein RsbU (phosphoserine phosphatase)